MAFEVKLPDIGEGVAEGEIVRWLVKPGDVVREDQLLVEVMTDKASVEIPSPRNGTIAGLHATEGQVVNVGATIITIDVACESAAPAATPAATPAAQAKPAAAVATAAVASSAPPASRVQATPAVRQLAKQLGVALEGIVGSVPGGAINTEDVKRAAGSGVSGATTTATPATPQVSGATTPAGAPAGSEERVPLRGLRRKIAEHMRHSIDTAAHFTFVGECDFTELVARRDALKARATAAGARLTFLPFVVKAMVESLKQHPLLNATLDDARGEIVIKRYYHVAIAVETADGLTAPVIHDADRRSVFELAREIDRLANAARSGKLKLEELQGGTITVTSTGAKGGVLATPILHHPQVAILGVHEIKPKPAVRDGQIVIRELGNLSLSLDHRVVDGAVGAEFLYDLMHRLETPAEWLTGNAIE